MRLTDEAEIARTRIYLTEARDARHLLMTGRNVASFRDQNGEEVTYSKGDLKYLERYILELEDLLGIARQRVGPPLRAIFG